MNCQLCRPTVQQNFIIFKGKIDIQQQLVSQHSRNIQRTGQLDVQIVLDYEK